MRRLMSDGGMTAFRSFVVLVCAALASSCGGKNGGPGNQTPQDQTITFQQAGPLSGAVGSAVTNTASGGNGTGLITYSSGNLAVATVNSATGAVSLVAVGSTTITASKAASSGYNAASANYTLNVTGAPQTIAFAQAGPLTVFVGATINNTASGGAGTGAITYASSNTSVLTVNATSGVATAIGAGAATVTATKAADASFAQAQATYSVTVNALQLQTITLNLPGPFTLAVGASLTNVASGGGGTGAITYASSNTSVLTVNATSGAATAVAAGTARVTATKAADPAFASAQATYDVSVLATQTITFTQAGPVNVKVGDTFANAAAGGAGIGAITYSSSNMNVLTVSTLGVVTAVAAGTATVTATKAADTNFAQAQATYTAYVVASLTFNAFIGESDTEVSLGAEATGFELVRSAQSGCAPIDCNPRESSIVGSAPISDTTLTLLDKSTYQLRTPGGSGGTSNPLVVNASRFGERFGHTALYFNNRYWVIGGGRQLSPNPITYNAQADVWSSADGATWVQETANGGFPARLLHQALVFNGRMWLIGGITPANTVTSTTYSSADGINWRLEASNLGTLNANSVFLAAATFNNAMWVVSNGNAYSSTDGITWTLQTTSPANPIGGVNARSYPSLTVYNGALWYIGGGITNSPSGGAANATNQVWRSPDGITWTQQTAPQFEARWRHSSFVLNNRLWVLGGQRVTNSTAGMTVTDAWSTADGATWTQEAATDTAAGYYQKAVQEPGRVTLIGGTWRGISNNVMQSTTGTQWTELSPYAPFASRLAAGGVSFNGAMWVVGGATIAKAETNDALYSYDGNTWLNATSSSPFDPRAGHNVLVFNNQLWVLGGQTTDLANNSAATLLSDVWSSPSGFTWTRHTTAAGFGPRGGAAAVVFNGRMWVIGGNTTGGVTNDVWSSDDGVTWRRDTAAAAFSARAAHSVVVYNGAMWLFGGASGGAGMNDVWTSVNGVNWTPVTATTSKFAPRIGLIATVFNNQMYIIGGVGDGPYESATRFSDVWSTTNGVQWTQVANAPFPGRSSFVTIAYANRLWVMTGFGFTRTNDVWRSPDGADWRLGYNGAFTFP